jgi:glycosyltransferase involved in cell wall biosynthesis
MKVLLIAPYYDQNVPGESWSTYKWVAEISKLFDTTVLTTHSKNWKSNASPTQAKVTINWQDPTLPKFLAPINRGAKPTYFLFYKRARFWIKKAISKGEEFDIVHQINPLALRYPCPALGLNLKYIIGPLAGSLETPPKLASNSSSCEPWYRKFRKLDRVRLKYDPWLRDTYRGASCVIGVAPYVQDTLKSCRPKSFSILSETGIDNATNIAKSLPDPSKPLKFLFVGRIIYTKGILHAIKAISIASLSNKITLDIIGEGELLKECKNLVDQLSIADIVRFHGRLPRDKVDDWYRNSDVFLFPSFREPSGNVIFEAMGHGLPVITSTIGGPGYIVNESCGYTVEPDTTEEYSNKIANTISDICKNPSLIPEKSQNAIERVTDLSQWSRKANNLSVIYKRILNQQSTSNENH